MSFDRSTFVIATPNVFDKGCICSGIDLASSAFLYGKSDTAFKLRRRGVTGRADRQNQRAQRNDRPNEGPRRRVVRHRHRDRRMVARAKLLRNTGAAERGRGFQFPMPLHSSLFSIKKDLTPLLLEAEETAVVTKRAPRPVDSNLFEPSLIDIRKLVEVIEP
jgi:hypothetical protein